MNGTSMHVAALIAGAAAGCATATFGDFPPASPEPQVSAAADRQRATHLVRAVLAAMRSVPAVPAGDIDVRVNGAIVTLSGRLDNVVVEQRLLSTVDAVRGVTVVVDDIRIAPLARRRTDAELAAEVEDALRAHPATEAADLRVSAHDGRVVLDGVVAAIGVRHLAIDLASRVRGVARVDDRITLRRRAVATTPEALASQVVRSLAPVRAAGARLRVRMDGPQVALDGLVPSARVLRRTIALAFVPGVVRVDAACVRIASEMASRER